MSDQRIRIGLQTEKSATPGSVVVTDVNNEQDYLVPGLPGQVLTINNSNVPEYKSTDSIKIPTPRIWARHNTNRSSSEDISSLSGSSWSVPEIYAQQFSKDDGIWRTMNPVYEVLVLKKVSKPSAGYVLKGKKWVHPAHLNQGNTVKKYAGGRTYSNSSGTIWQDRWTEFNVDISTKETFLKNLDPHDFISYQGNDTDSAGQNPIVGAWAISDFKNRFYFPPRTSRRGNIKLPFAVRIRIDNPDFQTGVSAQEPYLYGELSNILVFKPNLTNFADGGIDSDGNPTHQPFFFGWYATPEDSVQ